MQMNTNAVQICAHVDQTRTETGQHCDFINKVALRLKSVMFLALFLNEVNLHIHYWSSDYRTLLRDSLSLS